MNRRLLAMSIFGFQVNILADNIFRGIYFHKLQKNQRFIRSNRLCI